MGFTLSWKNRGTFVAGAKVEIFRYTSAPDVNNLTGSPLATITDMNVTSYVDTTCLLGATYYYVLRTTSGSRVAVSAPKMITIAEDLGPGPKTLLFGDRNFGFFGTVAGANVLTVTTGSIPVMLYKFVHNGRIIYVDSVLLSPNSALNAGYLSGGVIPAGLTSGTGFAGETKALINSSGRLFRVRAPKLYIRDNSVLTFGTKLLSEIEFGISEALDLYRFLLNKNMTSWNGPSFPIESSLTNGFMTSDASGNGNAIILPTSLRANSTIAPSTIAVSNTTGYSFFRVFEYYGLNPADVPAY